MSTKSILPQKLFDKRDALKLVIDAIQADSKFYPIPMRLIEKLLKDRKIKKGKLPYRKLYWSLLELRDSYGVDLSIKKLQNGKMEFKRLCSIPKYVLWKAKGDSLALDQKRRRSEFLDRAAKLGYLINEIEIDDVTNPLDLRKGLPKSQFLKVFEDLENKIIPTIVRYNYHNAIDLYLVHIPNELTPTDFRNLYMPKIGKIHADIYGKIYHQKKTSAIKTQIFTILEPYIGQHLAEEELAKIAQDKLGRKRENFPSILRRHKDVLRKIKRAEARMDNKQ